MGDALRMALLIAGKDLKVELRSRTALLTAAVFAALVLVVFNFARDPSTVAPAVLAPSVLWVTFTFAAMVTFTRSFALERTNAALDGLLLSPMGREALFVGKYLANLAFVLAIAAVALPLFILFFNVDLGGAFWGIAGLMVLAAIGFVAVGTVFGAMVVRTRFADMMLPVLLLPFLVPPVIAAVQATTRLLGGRPWSELWGWLRFLAVYDVVFLTVCLLLFPVVMDE